MCRGRRNTIVVGILFGQLEVFQPKEKTIVDVKDNNSGLGL